MPDIDADEIEDFLDNYADVKDGSYGEQMPNRAMGLLSELRRACGKEE